MAKADGVHSTRATDFDIPPDDAVNGETTARGHSGPLTAFADPRPSRRSALATLAGGAVLATTGPAAASPTPTVLSDQQLLDLGRQYDVALAAEDAACDAWTATCVAFDAVRPVAPAEMRHRMDDHVAHRFPVLAGTDRICDTDASDFYNEPEVEYLRAKPRTKRIDYIVDLATGDRSEAYANTPYDEITQEKHLKIVPDPEAQARADEIIGAWDRHMAACEVVAHSVGVHDAEAAYYKAVDARQAIKDAIVAARATTLHWLAVRARIVAGIIDDETDDDVHTTDQKMLLAIVRDLTAIAI